MAARNGVHGVLYMREVIVTSTVTVMTMLLVIFCECSKLAASEVPNRVHATVLGRESSVHTSVSNQDVYLIQVVPKSGKAFLAKMIDEYPPYADALPDAILSEGGKLSVALRRAPYCDQPLPVNTTGTDSSVRCFAVVHGSWKVKSLVRDEWWK
jgi:hypothetical protein